MNKPRFYLARFKFWGWQVSALLVCLVMLLPLCAIGYQALSGQWQNLQHFWQTMLGHYLFNSLLLVVLTLLFALIFALPSAWLITHYRFFGHKLLQWLLCLPLAMPAYLIAYLYTDLLDYSGSLQLLLRQLFGWQSPQDYWFVQIRSLYGAAFVLALVLYPYIFLLVRLALLEQAENLLQSAKTLGATPASIFRRITLPLIRPAIVVGMTLVAMETLGDFGTVAYFAVPTLTTAIYDAWLGLHDIGTASQISLFMLLMIFLLVALESYSRRKQKAYQRGYEKKPPLKPLRGLWAACALLWCWGLVGLAFLLPLARLVYWSYRYLDQSWHLDFLRYAQNSLWVSTIATLTTLLFALILHFNYRLSVQGTWLSPRSNRSLLQLSALGYAIPGTVLAIGLLVPLTFADHQLHGWLKALNLAPVGLIFSGSIFALVLAYSIRFSAMALGSLEASFGKIAPSLDMASQSLGRNGLKMLTRVHFPLLSKGILTALLMVFIESMKELNASLLLRPFNFDTLATHVFIFTSDEQLERAALPAVVLVLTGLIPVILLTRSLLQGCEKER